jgi:hypothetical protein
MKIRTGFVSNSSSSSFLIVGVANSDDKKFNEKIHKLIKLDECTEGWGGTNQGKALVFIGGELAYGVDDDEVYWRDYEPYYVGIPAFDKLCANLTVRELRLMFIRICKQYGVDFAENEVDLFYGEVSSE